MIGSIDLAMRLDPVVMAEEAGITPDGWQARVLRSRAQRILLNCSRQSGKTTCTALLCLHTALFEPKSLVLMVSPSLRQSSELFRSALGIYRALGRPVEAETENKLSLELMNGSRILSLPGHESTIRGLAGANVIAADESARIPDTLMIALRPMLATSNGRLIALSTPWGTRGWWYEAWRSSEPWERVMVRAEDCPRIPQAFLEEEQRTLGEYFYRQEYQAEFLDSETSAFRSEDIERLIDPGVEEWIL